MIHPCLRRLGLAVALTGVALLSHLGTAATDPAPPNIILIVVDDLGYGELGCYPAFESNRVHTPNIDRLARRGIRMTDGYAAHPMCWPSRASLLTGRYYQRFLKGTVIPETETLLGQHLKKAGYVTACVGKWHNTGSIGAWNGNPADHPLGRGFDEFFGFLGGMHDYFEADVGTHWLQGRNRPYYMPIYDGTQPVRKVKYLTEEFTSRAVDFIERHARRPWPFFLYLSYNAIHTPEQAPEKYLQRHQGDKRRAMIDALDEGIGRLLDTLKRLQIDQGTMVWFVGDNGGWRRAANWKLRSTKGNWFEGGLRVPFIVSWPKQLPEGQDFSMPMMHIDVVPTILAAASLKRPRNLDGQNLLPHWLGEAKDPPHEVLFWGDPGGSRFAARRGDWKLVSERISRQGRPELGLYQLSSDLEESKNQVQTKPDRVRQLQGMWNQWAQRIAQERE